MTQKFDPDPMDYASARLAEMDATAARMKADKDLNELVRTRPMTWEGLNPPYATIVADPPWHYEGFPPSHWPGKRMAGQNPMPYSGMSLADICALPVLDLAAADACLFVWTTNRYLRSAFDVVEAWGFRPTQTLVWCKPPKGLLGGAAFSIATEFVILGRRGHVGTGVRQDRNWWEWPRAAHSVKPAAFFDLVEQVSPGPYVELFARQPRLGWDHWGHGYEGQVA